MSLPKFLLRLDKNALCHGFITGVLLKTSSLWKGSPALIYRASQHLLAWTAPQLQVRETPTQRSSLCMVTTEALRTFTLGKKIAISFSPLMTKKVFSSSLQLQSPAALLAPPPKCLLHPFPPHTHSRKSLRKYFPGSFLARGHLGVSDQQESPCSLTQQTEKEDLPCPSSTAFSGLCFLAAAPPRAGGEGSCSHWSQEREVTVFACLNHHKPKGSLSRLLRIAHRLFNLFQKEKHNKKQAPSPTTNSTHGKAGVSPDLGKTKGRDWGRSWHLDGRFPSQHRRTSLEEARTQTVLVVLQVWMMRVKCDIGFLVRFSSSGQVKADWRSFRGQVVTLRCELCVTDKPAAGSYWEACDRHVFNFVVTSWQFSVGCFWLVRVWIKPFRCCQSATVC